MLKRGVFNKDGVVSGHEQGYRPDAIEKEGAKNGTLCFSHHTLLMQDKSDKPNGKLMFISFCFVVNLIDRRPVVVVNKS